MRRLLFLALSLSLVAAGCVETNQSTLPASGDVGVDDGGHRDASADTTTQPTPVTQPGPYNVGYRTIEITYTPEAYGDGEPRTLPVSVWYPTDEPGGEPPQYLFILREEVAKEASISNGQFPVMVFSHGNGSLKEQSYFLTEHWASHGWIVFSPDHIDNTFRTGTNIEVESAVYRPQDINALIERIHNFSSDHFFANHIGEFLAMSGHSMGAVTTLLVTGADIPVDDISDQCDLGRYEDQGCDKLLTPDRKELFRDGFLNQQIDVAIPQAPGGAALFQDGVADIDIPTMMFTGGMDQTLPNETEGDPLWMDMSGAQHRRINLPKAGHFTFSNMCDFFAGQPRIDDDGCGDSFIDPELAYDIVNAYSLAFARYHRTMSPRAQSLVDGERTPFDASTLELTVGAN